MLRSTDPRCLSMGGHLCWRQLPQHLDCVFQRQHGCRCRCAEGNHSSGSQEKETIRLKREAKTKGGFYAEPEQKLLFAIRIRGMNKVHPKVRLRLAMCLRATQR